MTTNNAPDPNFSGIDFNDSFFSSTSGGYVNYPSAGDCYISETISRRN
jgi:hypothetical protein